VIFDNQHEIQRLESIDELRNLGINPYPHFLRRDMNISKFRLKFNYINLIDKVFTDAGGDAISIPAGAPGQGHWTSSEMVRPGGGAWTNNQAPVLFYDNIKKTYVVGEFSARHNNACRIRPFVHF